MSEENTSSDVDNPSRRNFLKTTSSLLVCATLPTFPLLSEAGELRQFQAPPINGQTNHDFWSQPRVLNIKRYQNKEKLQISYWKDGRLDIDGYNKICWLMRDLKAGSYAQIDLRLLDLICAMQAWVSY